MEREVFAGRLREAAVAARDFARRFIEEPLPDPMLFRVRLNSSYDGDLRVGDEVVFPDDGSFQRAEELAACSEEQVIDTLWRDGRVPEWIDVAVIGETGAATLLQLLCCGRFTAQENLLYHEREGRPPFHVTGPTLPPSYEDGQKFSIYYRSECWSRGDVEQLRAHAHKVWSLDLIGDAFDDAALGDLPELPRMEILELKASPLEGRGVLELARFPKLRVLRLSLERSDSFMIPKLRGKFRGLQHFGIHDPPPRPWGFQSFVDRLPNLASLTLTSRDELFVDGSCPRSVQTLSITAKRIQGAFKPPKTIDSIYAHLSAMGDDDVNTWLSSVKQIRGLDLSGTPITDALAETFPARFGLTYLNVVDTKVSGAALQRIRDANAKLKLLPNLKAVTGT